LTKEQVGEITRHLFFTKKVLFFFDQVKLNLV